MCFEKVRLGLNIERQRNNIKRTNNDCDYIMYSKITVGLLIIEICKFIRLMFSTYKERITYIRILAYTPTHKTKHTERQL